MISSVSLVSTNAELVQCFRKHLMLLRSLPWRIPISIGTIHDSIENIVRSPFVQETAIATPGNALGLMNDGFDKHVLKAVDPVNHTQLANQINAFLVEKNNGYMPTKLASVISLSKYGSVSNNVTTIVHVPTMVLPQPLAKTDSHQLVFDCIWSCCLSLSGTSVSHLILPGFGSGYGGLDPDTVSEITLVCLVLFHLEVEASLKQCMILMLLQKRMELLQIESDIANLKHWLSDFGRWKLDHLQEGLPMELKDWIRCFDRGNT